MFLATAAIIGTDTDLHINPKQTDVIKSPALGDLIICFLLRLLIDFSFDDFNGIAQNRL